MARIVIRCQYTGHYVFTGSEHVWSSTEAQLDDRERAARRQKPLVRQAS
jgi:hypothetical protein